MRSARIFVGVLILCGVGLGSAWAQIAVTDPATTGRNAITAALKNQILDTARRQQDRLAAMARRLTATTLARYRLPERTTWRAYEDAQALLYADSYRMALAHGDPSGTAYSYVARSRLQSRETLAGLSPFAREVMASAFATLDVADSTMITGTHLAGVLRWDASAEFAAIDGFEADVADPSELQSTTAVIDKLSGAALIEARQKQDRLQYLTAITEQLVLDNKRARDTESALLNMQLHRLRSMDSSEDGHGMLTGVASDLRTWRQP